jgi:hypothetical protein
MHVGLEGQYRSVGENDNNTDEAADRLSGGIIVPLSKITSRIGSILSQNANLVACRLREINESALTDSTYFHLKNDVPVKT